MALMRLSFDYFFFALQHSLLVCKPLLFYSRTSNLRSSLCHSHHVFYYSFQSLISRVGSFDRWLMGVCVRNEEGSLTERGCSNVTSHLINKAGLHEYQKKKSVINGLMSSLAHSRSINGCMG